MSANAKRVLIVEDEKPLARALELKLQHEGFETIVAQNGEECVELISNQKFDVVLLDLMMPVMDGFQVLQKLQNQEHRPAVFVLSNLSQHEDEDRVMALGARKYFVKSDTPLTTIIEEVKQV